MAAESGANGAKIGTIRSRSPYTKDGDSKMAKILNPLRVLLPLIANVAPAKP
jgi:hypothetical protein